jgi:ADP-ribosylglycohydrolase
MGVCNGQSDNSNSPNDKLFSRIYGCEAAVRIANAMGASVEGWTYDRIEKTYGFLDKFLPEEQKESIRSVRFGPQFAVHAYHREPGWGEDGMERYRLLTSAILKKGGRVNIEDVSNEWIHSIDPARFGYNVGPQDQCVYYLMKAGVPPSETGGWALWPGFIGTSKMIVPVGMINAGRPDNAARDALDITRFKDVQGRPLWRDDTRTLSKSSIVVYDYALEVAAGIAAGIAEALKPDATVNSVLDAVLAQLPSDARIETETILKWAREAKDWKAFRPIYQKHYFGTTPISNAMEILSGGLACFMFADGQPREAILIAVNMGRDTDCKAYVAGSLAGALRGIEALPVEWVQLVETAVISDPYAVSRRTAREAAEGIYKAYLNEQHKSDIAVGEIESMIQKTPAEEINNSAPNTQLFSRIYGCEAAATVGSSMGFVVNGMSFAQIQRSYGSLKKLMELDKPSRTIAQRYGPGWIQKAYKHLPGMTESGMERHRLTTSAIIEKNGRVGVEEVAKQWTDNIDTTKFGFLLGPEDKIVYAGLKGGLPPWEVGRYSQSPGSIDVGRLILPIGMVNACSPEDAVRDALDVARLKDVQGRSLGNINGEIIYDYAIEASAAIAAATAEALRPEATVNSIVSTALAQLPDAARKEVEAGVGIAKKAKKWEEFSKLFEQSYAGNSSSTALDVLSSSLACFVFAEGDPKNTIIYSVNLGHDASSRASIAGGLAGALRGIQSVPSEWVEVIEKEVVDDPYTISRLTARQAAEGIYKACLSEMQKTKTANAKITSLIGK